MAKSRRNRAKGNQRSDPIAKPVKPPSDPELAAIREKSILPVLKDLQSSEPKSRTAAAGAIANIVQDPKCRKLLLREKIVHILLNETLTDASLESRAAGWEILRILTAEEESDFCVHLYRVDVLTAIQHACAKIAATITSSNPAFSKITKAEQNFVWSIAESLTAILLALAEAQPEALDAAARNEQIVSFLFTLVLTDFTTAPVLNSALLCMITFSELSKEFGEVVTGHKTFKQLVAFKNGGGYKAVLACAVLHNISSLSPLNTGAEEASDAVLIPTLTQVLEHAQLNGGTSNGDSSTSPAETLQLALEILADIGTTLQQTLEQGNKSGGKREVPGEAENAMEADGDEDLFDNESDEEDGDNGDDDEMDQDEMEADMEMVTGADDGDNIEGIDDLPALRELIHKAIPQVVKLLRANGGNDETSELIRGHALTVLNNISWTVSCIDFADKSNKAIQRAWTPAAHTIWQQIIAPVLSSNTSDVELASIVASLAWAIARTLHGQAFLSVDEHKKFISLYHASRNLNSDQEDPFQSLGVKCIGVLGQFALVGPIELNREMGIFLLTVVKGLPETPAADAVEALNQLFDIYGDENKPWDKEVFWKDNFLQHFEEVAPRVKAMVKTIDKRKSAELRVRAEEANLNLSRFIRYKQKHRP
ncbi:hypothetical protein F5Y11DRAFT_132578 [Daldinia sp. FL1419]|nr:hypothetical protein F5Y11DRAFT_132578 [Daldinia sp. FL1419]